MRSVTTPFLSIACIATVSQLAGARPLIELLRLLDSGICAQLASHTFYIQGVPLPLCARNTGVYLGASLTLTALWLRGRERWWKPPSLPVIVLLLAMLAIMALDGANSTAHDLGLATLYTPSNPLRLATGLLAGVSLTLLLWPVVAHALWGNSAATARTALPRATSVLPFVLPLVPTFALVALQPGWLLYPISLVSSLGLYTVVAGINAIGIRAGGALLWPKVHISRSSLLASAAVFTLAELLVLAAFRLTTLGPSPMMG